MSNIQLSLFRTLTPELRKHANIALSDYSFHYTDASGMQKTITKKNDTNQCDIEIPGKGSQWDPESDNLLIQRDCTISNPESLFGFPEGIANSGSVLGVALVILSRDSSQRSVYDYEGTIVKQKNACVLSLTASLPARTYRCSMELKTVLYLKRKSSVPEQSFFGNTEGMILGVLSRSQLHLEERAPEFPTRIIKLGPKEPLWKLKIDWNDPRTDTFADTIMMVINESFPGYDKIWGCNADEKDKNAMRIEIYSSALVAVIEKVRENKIFWEDTVNANLETIEGGSVSDWLCYIFNAVLGSSNLDTNEMSLRIRKKLGERE